MYGSQDKCRVELQGVSDKLFYNGSYDAIYYDPLTLDEAIQLFSRLPTSYPPGKGPDSDEDECPVHMIIRRKDGFLSISLQQYNKYYIMCQPEGSDEYVEVADEASWDDVIDIIRKFYLAPQELGITSPSHQSEQLITSETPSAFQCEMEIRIIDDSGNEGVILMTERDLGGIPLSNIIEIELSKGIKGISKPSMTVKYLAYPFSKTIRFKVRLASRDEVPLYYAVLAGILPGKVKMK
ncbi:MAG: hypothetical protein ACXQTI_03235 [Candidatus Nezhaarchaeales archaeon]